MLELDVIGFDERVAGASSVWNFNIVDERDIRTCGRDEDLNI